MERVQVGGVVPQPELVGEHSEVAVRFWAALGESGQGRFFEPSDWAAAELVVLAIDAFVSRPSANMLASIQSLMTSLLVTEGDRRRARIELERAGVSSEEPADVSEFAEYRRRLRSS